MSLCIVLSLPLVRPSVYVGYRHLRLAAGPVAVTVWTLDLEVLWGRLLDLWEATRQARDTDA